MPGQLLGLLGRIVRDALAPQRRPARTRPTPAESRRPASDYPGDFVGVPHFEYSPHEDAVADPGEVVWTWVPFEEDHSQGKDRPVLILGRDAGWLLAAQLTSKDHDRDARQEASEGRYWMDIGTGSWDPRRRPSEVRLNRVIRVAPTQVRRTGGRLDRDTYLAVARAIAQHLAQRR